MALDTIEDFAVVVSVEDQTWQVGVLPERLTGDLDGLVAALRQQPGDIGAIGLVNVADEFFVAIRVVGNDVRLLLSDVTAAVAWDLAAQVCEVLGVPVPGDDDIDDVWPAGDLAIFADLGMDEMELGAVLSDLEAYADEMLSAIAARLGFGEVYERALEGAVR
jgi:putative tRNA adenosine deaminase-associated protein